MQGKRDAGSAPFCDQVCKPSSVLSSHLSWPAVASRLTPPPRNARATPAVKPPVPIPRCCSG